ncbi:hypothetical protein [Streptomyces sp. NPDC051183]|uniref:hypothetical protein n=1 Tax=unclassified Streptomyces TaxID=2593676 RepID=UPI00341EAAB9
MTHSSRRFTAALLCACALAAGGCAAPGGLVKGTRVAPVSVQPHPESLWPAWTDTPGAAVGGRAAPPKPLKGAPEVGPDGLKVVDAMEVLRADPQMAQLAKKGPITGPGRAGIRPFVYRDLTGDGKPELIVAVDAATGRTALSVYSVVNGKIVAILFTIGRQMAIEAVGTDLLVRTASDDGAEQAVRYHWGGDRMTVVNDEKRFLASGPGCDAKGSPAHRCSPGEGPNSP